MRYLILLTYWTLPMFVFGQTIANNHAFPTNKPTFSLLELAKRARSEGKIQDAFVQLDAVIQLDANNCEAYSERALVQAALNESWQALNDFGRAAELCPSEPYIYVERGNLLYQLNRFDDALRDFDVAIDLSPNIAKAFYLRGQCFSAVKKYDTALVAYNKAIQLDSSYAMIFNNRGVVKSLLGDMEGAIGDYDKGIVLDSAKIILYQNRARANLQLSKLGTAIKDFNEAIRLSPNEAELYCQRAILKRIFGDYEGSLVDINDALRLSDTENASYFLQRGLTYYHWRKMNLSLRDLNKTIAIDAHLAEAFYYKGLYFKYLNQQDSAFVYFAECIKNDNKHIGAYSARGDIYYRSGRFEEAALDYSQILLSYPDDDVAYMGRANAYRNLGKYKNAIDDYTEAIRFNSKNDQGFHGRAMSKFQSGSFRSAILDFGKAIDLMPQKETYFNRAFAKLAFGDKDGACEDFYQAAQMGLYKANSEAIVKLCKTKK